MIGRNGKKPVAIVLHVTEGKFEGSLSWCLDPKSQVSYHYIVNRNGDIYKLVEETDTAWSQGLVKNSKWPLLANGSNPNEYCISIAYAGFAEMGPSIEQMSVIAILVRDISARWHIKLDKNFIIGHNIIRTDKICPGSKFDINALLSLASLQP